MPQPTYTTRLLEKVPRVGDIVTFRWQRPEGYDFQAGQWFVITFPRAPGAEPHTHHFSHSASPLEPILEFTTRLRGSEFKNALDALPLGAPVEVEGPYGSFTLTPDLEQVAFLTGGIGITCVRSILRWLAEAPQPRLSRTTALFANRSEEVVPFRQELAELAARIPQLRVVHVLSRPDEGWQGHRGHIDGSVLSQEFPDPRSWVYYLSGPPSLVESMRRLLLAQNVSAGAIRAERFEGYE